MRREQISETPSSSSYMNFWVIHAQEPLPQPSHVTTRRLWRSNTIAEMLTRRGHRVVRWRSGYSHYEKCYLVSGSPRVEFEGFEFQFLEGPTYKHHIGYRRIKHHQAVARKFAEIANTMDHRPDVIHVSNVPLELCRAVVAFSARLGIPVVIDVRDLWPDLFLDIVPDALALIKPWLKLLARYSYQDAAYAMRNATAITGITEPFVDWGLRLAERKRTEWDQVFHMSYPESGAGREAAGIAKLSGRLGLKDGEFICCYFGSIGHQSDFDTLIEAARLMGSRAQAKFVICGDGPKLRRLRKKASGLSNVVFPGWLEAEDVRSLMQVATVGLIPFKERDNYTLNMPNKFSEYLSGGLVLACGLRGEMARLIEAHDCGFVYPTGDAATLTQKLIELAVFPPARLQAMKENAKVLFREQFNYKVIYARLCAYLEVMGSSPRREPNE